MAAGTGRPLSRPIFVLPLSPLLPPAESSLSMWTADATGNGIRLDHPPPLSSTPQHGPSVPSLLPLHRAQPPSRYPARYSVFTIIIVVRFLSTSLSLPLSLLPPLSRRFVLSLPFILVHAPKIAAITVCPSQRQTFYVRWCSVPDSLCFNSVGVSYFSLWHVMFFTRQKWAARNGRPNEFYSSAIFVITRDN